MALSTIRSRKLRWAVPAGALVVVGAGIAAPPTIAAVRGPGQLPDVTARQLLTDTLTAGRHTGSRSLSGTVVASASLGLPQLPGNGNGTSLTSLLSGSHTMRIWYGDARHVRVALPDDSSETDVIRNGDSVWQWSSADNTATHLTLPGKAQLKAKKPHGGKATPQPTAVPLAPQQLADQMLTQVGKHASLSVADDVRVAGRSAYQLAVVPKQAGSLVGKVTVAIDGKTHMPLRIQVVAKGQHKPAIQVGYTSLTFTKPAAGNFTFTPPHGAKVKTHDLGKALSHAKPRQHAPNTARPRILGTGWTRVVELPADLTKQLMAGERPTAKPGKHGMMQAFLKSGKQVSGDWGSGRLWTSELLTMLRTDDGRIYAGAVTPSTLTSAVGGR